MIFVWKSFASNQVERHRKARLFWLHYLSAMVGIVVTLVLEIYVNVS